MKQKLIPVILVLVVGGFVGWMVFFREPNPEDVVGRMMLAMDKVRSLHYEAAVEGTADLSNLPIQSESPLTLFTPQEKEIMVNLLIRGDYSETDSGEPSSSASTLEFNITTPGAPAALAAVTLDMRYADKVSYLALTDVTSAFLPIDVAAVRNKWYKFEGQKALEEFEARKEAVTLEEAPSTGFDAEKVKAINDLTARTDFFEVTERLGDEEVGGIISRHYKVKLNLAATRSFIHEVAVIVDAEITDQNRMGLDRLMEELQDFTGELWIGRRDNLLYRMKWTLPFSITVEENEVPVTVLGTTNLSKFDEPVTVEAPAGAEDVQKFLEDLLGGLLGGFLPGGLPNAGEREPPALPGASSVNPLASPGSSLDDPDTDLDGLTATQEAFWGTNVSNPDTDGDGFTDGDEVNSGHNPNGPGALF